MVSKLLTETLIQIFYELELDELFSCILVNREWCQIAIPILWSDPWKNIDIYVVFRERIFNNNGNGKIKKYILLISTYISCLSDDDRNKLNLSGIPTSNLKPFFDYPIFLRYLNYHHFIFLTNKFVSEKVEENNENLTKLIIRKIWNLFKEKCKKLVHFGLLNPYEGNNYRFDKIFNDDTLKYSNGLETKSIFINISSFQCDGNVQPMILFKLGNICKLIQDIKIDNISQDNEGIAYLIKSQKSLQKLFLGFYYDAPKSGFSKIEDVLKDIDSLNRLILSGRFPLSLNLFSKCSKLQELELLLNESNNGMEEFVKNKFPGLRYLKICFRKISARQLSLLINNTQGNIEKIFIIGCKIIDPENSFIFKDSIINKCCNLRELALYVEPIGDFLPPLSDLFKNCIHLECIMMNGSKFNETYDFGQDLMEVISYIPKNLKYILVPNNFCSNKDLLKEFGELVKEQFKISIHESSDSIKIIFYKLI
ncbi:hypothetical protein RclHR1_02190011 [Rhizophagus clarus]|uniref:F-box domain-containing protein n=1 Tax=Rhizophagus clarus TaxID=94130 RepID=A0A2Z6RMG5_9GLOM|nr:hypothetical protein RclHR1_02190011 [Rhizophagus clarus]GES73658.1 hypothetical protein GLOIN_2v76400 [Rhizophagus clarus]